jgi:hypothetical protein
LKERDFPFIRTNNSSDSASNQTIYLTHQNGARGRLYLRRTLALERWRRQEEKPRSIVDFGRADVRIEREALAVFRSVLLNPLFRNPPLRNSQACHPSLDKVIFAHGGCGLEVSPLRKALARPSMGAITV